MTFDHLGSDSLTVKSRVNSNLIWAAALVATDVMTRTRRYVLSLSFCYDLVLTPVIRRTSPDMSLPHHLLPASERRSARLPVPALPPSSPTSTLHRDASYDTFACSACTTTCCWRRSMLRTWNACARLRPRPL